jgi:type II secretory pathway pseudopilin PulG
MKTGNFNAKAQRRTWRSATSAKESAFSLVEILVTVALLAFIILGLLGMFIQTQKAFRGSMKQTDVLGSGRAVMDMIARELAQMTPSQMRATINFSADIPPGPNQIPPSAAPINSPPYAEVGTVAGKTYPPIKQTLPGAIPPVARTNVIQRIFFLTLVNQDWIGTGYEVVADYPGGQANSGVGTLYRFAKIGRSSDVGNLWSSFANTPVTNTQYFSRIADGVVHLRVKPYATNGFPIVWGSSNACWFQTNVADIGRFSMRNTLGSADQSVPEEVNCYFFSNALPAYVELELGILEPNILDRYKSISGLAANNYLADHVANVHLFRQKVPVRNVDFNAYQ